MKIGILTLPLHTNYGGILQAYALQTTLERLGHEVHVINYYQQYKKFVPDPVWRRFITYPLRFISKFLLRRYSGAVRYEHNINKARKYKDKYLKQFVDSHIHFYKCDTLSEVNPSAFDALVVGSDQVWRKPYFGGSERIENAFLHFTKGWIIRRIAYAASFGRGDIEEYNEIEKKACSLLAKQFDAISVREKSGVSICQKEFGVNAQHVLDPTLLLSRNDYEEIAQVKDAGTHILFYYILDETPAIYDAIIRYADNKGLSPLRVNALREDENCSLELRVQRPIEEWLAAFATADEVVTDSFHACVFSIIFNKPFRVLINAKRGLSRISSLLDSFGLKDRMIQDITELKSASTPINWENVNCVLEKNRKISISFLENNLKGIKYPPRQIIKYDVQKLPLFSIVIPVFNSKEGIQACVDSIMHQSYDNFEVILVDDGSTDGSSETCNLLASLDQRVRVIHKPNGGPSSARNAGISEVQGDWILFADADDSFLPEALRVYYEIIKDFDVGIIRTGYIKKGKSGIVRKVAIDAPRLVEKKEDFYLISRETGYAGFLWNGCFKRDIAQQFKLDEEISWCEDHIYTYECMSVCSKVFFTNALTYKYTFDDIHLLGAGECLSTKRKDYRMIIRAAEKDRKVKMLLYEGSPSVLSAIEQSYQSKIQTALYYAFFEFNPLLWRRIVKNYADFDTIHLYKEYQYYLKTTLYVKFKKILS